MAIRQRMSSLENQGDHEENDDPKKLVILILVIRQNKSKGQQFVVLVRRRSSDALDLDGSKGKMHLNRILLVTVTAATRPLPAPIRRRAGTLRCFLLGTRIYIEGYGDISWRIAAAWAAM